MHLVDFEHFIVQGINPLSASSKWETTRQMLNPAGGLTASECIAVYRNNITSARVRALQTIYPVCETILGDDCFRAMARGYAWNMSDDCADLNVYGEQFSEHLDGQQKIYFPGLDYLKELAMLEWHCHAACYAADNTPFDYESFACHADHPERLRFTLADGLFLMEAKYPVREIWQRHRAQENPDSIPALEGCEYLCIYRPHYEPRLAYVDRTTYLLLLSIENGSTLWKLSNTVESSETLAELLPVLIRQGWVSGFESIL